MTVPFRSPDLRLRGHNLSATARTTSRRLGGITPRRAMREAEEGLQTLRGLENFGILSIPHLQLYAGSCV